MDRSEFYEVLASIPGVISTVGPEACRDRFLEALGYDPADVTIVEDDGQLEPIAEGVPVVERNVPSARRFVLRVGEDPIENPPVPDHPEEVAYPTLRAIYDEIDVDYAVHLTEHRIIVYSQEFARTYVFEDHEAISERPTYELLEEDGASDVYDRLAVAGGPSDQSSIGDY